MNPVTAVPFGSKQLIRPDSCGKCKFSTPTQGSPQRQCRRNPPTALHFQVSANQFGTYSNFPIVQPDSWCGEYRPQIEGVQ